MQEQQDQIKIYGFFQKLVYFTVVMDCLILFYQNANIVFLSEFGKAFARTGIYFPPVHAKLTTLALIALVAVGTRAKKDKDLKIVKKIILPIVIGLVLIFTSFVFVQKAADLNQPKIIPYLSVPQILYILFSFLGAVITQVGADNISKYLKSKLGKDRWNTEEESFQQNTELIETPTSVNIPYLFRYKKKNHNGYINLNPFRGTVVIGTPGSGKSFGILNPAIRQMIQKGFCLCIYDFKFPDQAEIAYYHYLLKKQNDKDYKHQFNVINLDNVEHSKRINPFKSDYIRTLADAQEMAESMVSSLQKGGGSGAGSDQFFTQSAVNFLASCIYFFAIHENGKYSDLPHILSFMNRSYDEIFDTLFDQEELTSLLSPFKSAYQNRAFDQLEGQVGTLKIFISRLATKESFWVFSGDDVQLKLSDKEHPSILILASNPATQDINSALYSAVLNRVLRLINSKNNLPSGIVADEFPTIYIHKIDNVVATARSNKVAVFLGLQELPQLRQFYKREVADTIISIIGNILSGSARDKNTLDWLERIFGKVKQQGYSESISQQGTTMSINEKLEPLIPAGKIAALKTGEMVGLIARDQNSDQANYQTSAMKGKINLNLQAIQTEEQNYQPIPTYYSFVDKTGKDRKAEVLIINYRRINKEVELIISQFIKTEAK